MQKSAQRADAGLDATRRVFHPIENRFISIPDNVQVIAAVNRGSEFSATFGIDPAQLDRFARCSSTTCRRAKRWNFCGNGTRSLA